MRSRPEEQRVTRRPLLTTLAVHTGIFLLSIPPAFSSGRCSLEPIASALVLHRTYEAAFTRFTAETTVSQALREKQSIDYLAQRYSRVRSNSRIREALESALTQILLRRPRPAAFTNLNEFYIAEAVYFFEAHSEIDHIITNDFNSDLLTQEKLIRLGRDYQMPTIQYGMLENRPNLTPNRHGWSRVQYGRNKRITGRFTEVRVNHSHSLLVGETVFGRRIEIRASHIRRIIDPLSNELRNQNPTIARVEGLFRHFPSHQEDTPLDIRPGYIMNFPGESGGNIDLYIARDSQRWGIRNQRIFRNTAPQQLPRNHAYTFVILETGEIVYGQVRDNWEFNVKHFFLAENNFVVSAGEMRVDASGAIQYNNLSGTYSRAFIRSGVITSEELANQTREAFFALGASSVEFVGERVLLPNQPPTPEELDLIIGSPEFSHNLRRLQELCRGVNFLAANPSLCQAVSMSLSP